MPTPIAERRAKYAAEMAVLAIRRWEIGLEMEGIDKRLRLLKGADDEAETSQKEFDALQEIAAAQRKALEDVAKPPKKSPAKVVDATPKKK